MRALQYRRVGQAPELVDIPDPVPGPGQVLLDITAAGACHSDAFIMGLGEDQYTFGLPLTLGHEGAGRVAAVGDGVADFPVGMDVIVYGPWGCGRCRQCARGMENYCGRAGELGIFPPGLGSPGAMADKMLVDSPRHLIPIGDLDPVATVPLTDAGLTPYHAIKRSLPKVRIGSTVVVIGVGGLGHTAIQLLRHMTPARIVAVDVSLDKLRLAEKVGAHETILSDADSAQKIRKITGSGGAAAVFDFVGYQNTLDLSMAVAGTESDVSIVGLGDGHAAAEVGFFRGAYETNVSVPYWGGRDELFELVDLAKEGILRIDIEEFALDDAAQAYRRLAEGTLTGRAVVVP
ncbi:alcohol dehydrogenase [Rhodococcus sp. RS1C4]|nr:NAD(P)-dependent alcohol dehydrogenase [Rhodococcus sp. RS1C4]OZC57651.1 alcohol dehydrogenase [Rhodococcus sp. RS1C4]